MIYTYAPGRTDRVPFDPDLLVFDGCAVCGDRRIKRVGIFVPSSPELRAAVMIVRRHPLRVGSEPGLAYGLCRSHGRDMSHPDRRKAAMAAIEDRIFALAEKAVHSCN
jgi:hypothetical protein